MKQYREMNRYKIVRCRKGRMLCALNLFLDKQKDDNQHILKVSSKLKAKYTLYG